MKIAVIDEDSCVGCTKCLSPCPTDAIIGAIDQMHTVINEFCIGCGLCIAPCPMDCIRMIEVNQPKQPANITKMRNKIHNTRIGERKEQKELQSRLAKINKQELLRQIITKT